MNQLHCQQNQMNQYRQKLKLSTLRELDESKYIQLCFLFKDSGANRTEITQIFDESLEVEKDYDKEDREELIDYLVKKSNE